MKTPFVTVVIPNYNHARYLDKRIQSVLAQTYQNFEVVILDDKSTDDSLEIIRRYRSNSHVSCVLANETNSGSTFKQWHKGFELAKGDLIWIAESDDWCEDNLLETLVGFFERDPECVLAFNRSQPIRDDGTYIENYVERQSEILSGIDFISQRMTCGNSIANASSALFSKQIAISIPLRYMDFKGAGDRLFWIEIAEHGNVGIDYHRLNYFRIHDNNSTKRYYFEGINQQEDYQILLFIKEKGYVTDQQFLRAKRRYAQWNIFTSRLSSDKKHEICQIWGLGIWDRVMVFYYHVKEVLEYKFGIK
jgi:glycosyltransferase involved in cell wall biosynthesis